MGEGLHSRLGAVSLLGGQSAKGNHHGGVHSASIVEEDANDLLDTFLVSSI